MIGEKATHKSATQVPNHVWVLCQNCQTMHYKKKFVENLSVCSNCGHHHRLTGNDRVTQLTDRFEPLKYNSVSHDPLAFVDIKQSYNDRLTKAKKNNGDKEAFIAGVGCIGDNQFVLGCFDFSFIGGSMGVAVGERFYQAAQTAISLRCPFVCVAASGGARMHEGVYSLLQMSKVSAAIAKLRSEKTAYVAILTDPTTGGVSASLATSADIIWAEPGALIGFTGPRVIAQTVKQKLPEGFQTSEFLFEKGLIDSVVARKNLKFELGHLLGLLPGNE
tara:strand:+ start:4369 stop:5196 length:828 start_codon:yes stop_codon:yes gene_type:complete